MKWPKWMDAVIGVLCMILIFALSGAAMKLPYDFGQTQSDRYYGSHPKAAWDVYLDAKEYVRNLTEEVKAR